MATSCTGCKTGLCKLVAGLGKLHTYPEFLAQNDVRRYSGERGLHVVHCHRIAEREQHAGMEPEETANRGRLLLAM
jgi:hypothetical protein